MNPVSVCFLIGGLFVPTVPGTLHSVRGQAPVEERPVGPGSGDPSLLAVTPLASGMPTIGRAAKLSEAHWARPPGFRCAAPFAIEERPVGAWGRWGRRVGPGFRCAAPFALEGRPVGARASRMPYRFVGSHGVEPPELRRGRARALPWPAATKPNLNSNP